MNVYDGIDLAENSWNTFEVRIRWMLWEDEVTLTEIRTSTYPVHLDYSLIRIATGAYSLPVFLIFITGLPIFL